MKIAFLILDNMLVTSFFNAYELMYAARMKAKSERHPDVDQIKLYKLAYNVQPVNYESGISIQPDKSIQPSNGINADQDQCFEYYDMVFVPALWRNPRPVVKKNPYLVAWLKTQWEHGAVINATGSGVFLVAESGLLDQQAATTHWNYFDALVQDYPNINLKRQHFITSAGKLFCAASINAQTDLVLHHVHRFIGKSVSEHLSRHFSHEVRQPYDRLSFDQEKENAHPDEVILQAQLWLQNNLNKPQITVSPLAEYFGMSARNFNRRFRQATGITPLQYLQEQRYQEAKDLLKNSDLNIGEIAFRIGYLDVSYFTKQFKKRSGVTPKDWRNSVRAKLFEPSNRL